MRSWYLLPRATPESGLPHVSTCPLIVGIPTQKCRDHHPFDGGLLQCTWVVLWGSWGTWANTHVEVVEREMSGKNILTFQPAIAEKLLGLLTVSQPVAEGMSSCVVMASSGEPTTNMPSAVSSCSRRPCVSQLLPRYRPEPPRGEVFDAPSSLLRASRHLWRAPW
jgi:hypothetical protein